MKPLEVLKTCPKWRHWMEHWVSYDYETEEYVGSCPDHEEICRDCGPTDFLNKFEEASIAWERDNGGAV